MKIERLYTLSQFVDIMETGMRYNLETKGEDYETIVQYNNFLKQPLKKEMFVNDKKKPLECYADSKYGISKQYHIALRWFEEAEKKVIFEGFKQWKQGYFELENGLVILFKGNGVFMGKNGSDSNYIDIEIKTLHDLVEATNRELTLKNVEL